MGADAGPLPTKLACCRRCAFAETERGISVKAPFVPKCRNPTDRHKPGSLVESMSAVALPWSGAATVGIADGHRIFFFFNSPNGG